MTERMPCDEGLIEAARRAELVLQRAWGAQVRLTQVEDVAMGARRNIVARCMVDTAFAGAPESVVIKQMAIDAYDPEAPSLSAWGLFNEWAGMQFLGSLEVDPPLAPRFYGGDRSSGLIVLEDLGSSETILDPLLHGSASAATEAVAAFSARLGDLHAHTAGKIGRWVHLRAPLGALRHPTYTGKGLGIRQSTAALHHVLLQLGIAPRPRFDAEVETVAQALEPPSPFFTFIHGDPCADNCVKVGRDLRFIDLEFGRFQLALLDWVYGLMIFPSCWSANRVPRPVLQQMEVVYRTALAKGCPEATDDELFDKAVVDACAAWILTTMYRYLPRSLKEPGKHSTREVRQRIVARLASFVSVAAERGGLEEIQRVSAATVERLSTVWSISSHDLPLYPAFASHIAPAPATATHAQD